MLTQEGYLPESILYDKSLQRQMAHMLIKRRKKRRRPRHIQSFKFDILADINDVSMKQKKQIKTKEENSSHSSK